MNSKLTVKREDLDNAKDEWEYLDTILDKYFELWKAEPDNIMLNFTDDQISLFFYGMLYTQVQNGGFLQLLFNGFADHIFETPLIDDLDNWGITNTTRVLKDIEERCLEVSKEIKEKEYTLEELSQSYSLYPEFEKFDVLFYKNNGGLEVRNFVEKNIDKFIIVE